MNDGKRKIRHIAKLKTESEKSIEVSLTNKVKAHGGVALKFTSHSRTGYPDRLCILPGGITLWIELKSKGKKPTRIQQERIKELQGLGQYVAVCDSVESVEWCIDEIMRYGF